MPKYNSDKPEAAQKRAKNAAARGVISFLTKGRLRVRDIRASDFGSRAIFMVFAAAQERNVPVVRYRRVKVLVESVPAGSRAARVVE